jgi:hypothetical protein
MFTETLPECNTKLNQIQASPQRRKGAKETQRKADKG